MYRGEDSRLRRTLAMKILSGAVATPDRTGRFEEEARAVSALNHPNILTIPDVARRTPSPFAADLRVPRRGDGLHRVTLTT